MYTKHLRPNEISHNVFYINKYKIFEDLEGNGDQYDYFVTNSRSPSEKLDRQLVTIQRFIFNNYEISHESGSYLYSFDGSRFPTSLFQGQSEESQVFTSTEPISKKKIRLKKGEVQCVTYFKHLLTQERTYLEDVIDNNIEQDGYRSIYLDGDILMLQGNNAQIQDRIIGMYVPYLNCLLWADDYSDWVQSYHLSYFFTIHQFEYNCSVQANQLNLTRNHSAYSIKSQFHNNRYLEYEGDPFITSIGLYGDDENGKEQLLAIAKLSTPVRKSSIIPTSFIIQFDYIP